MKFFHFLTFAVAASATPVPGLELSTEKPKDLATRQANNLAQVALNAVTTASNTIDTSLDTIASTLAAAGDNINVDVQAVLEANLNAISAALGQGAGAVTGAIAAAGGNIANAVTGYGLVQVLQLVTASNRLVALLKQLGVRLDATIDNLDAVAPAALEALNDELALIRDAVDPFVTPVGEIINAVRRITLTGSLLLTGFDRAVPGLLGILDDLLGGL
ncbi:hypothetical protein Micbo1qcDRAFT_208960 [Microdochium bolleyi]|uniref:Hydrophobic surface binding protein A-domain-containing protein n=1 Tax=Microdochium bolleyi TaxID=196109 RepID=A0A136INP6_9PEZI|nr:hypothetical protein Micbo1qcDRAFT_208960 [Microdochium bolleyi]